MPNYNEQTISNLTLQKWWRANQVNISNPYNELPVVSFSEEEVSKLGDDVIRKENVGGLQLAYDPTYVVTLLDPDTNLPTGSTVTLGTMFEQIYSLYFQLAAERDNQ